MERFKLFYKNNHYYLTKDEDVIVGDLAIVTVNDLYPTVVECINEDQINLFQKPTTKSTKRYKVVEKLSSDSFDSKTNQSIKEKEGAVVVEYNDGQIRIIEE